MRSALIVATALLAAAPAAANPVDAFGFGARGPALGRAQTAAARDGGANYYNPGILATLTEIHIDLGYQFAAPGLTVNGLDLDVDAARGLAASLVVPGNIAGLRVALGSGVFLPDERITRTRTFPADRPRFALYDNRPQRLFFSVNLAAQLGDRVFAGGGVAYMSSTHGVVSLDGRVGFPDAADSELDLAIDVDLETVRYPQAGVLWRARPWLDLGLAYRGGFTLVLDQVFDVRGDVGPAGGNPVVEDGFFILSTVSQDLFQPTQVAAGLSARLTDDVTLAFDAVFERWSTFENPAAHIEIDLELGDFNDLVMIPDAPPLPDPNFHDVVSPRLGLEWTATRGRRADLALRAGYAYEPTPTPEQSGETNFVDNDKHTLSAGAGLTLRGLTDILPLPFSVDLFAGWSVLPERSHRKLSPVNRIGDYRAGGQVWQLGLSTSWDL